MTDTLEDYCLPTIKLGKGKGAPGKQACWMSALSAFLGTKWTDRLECVDPVINAFCISINDAFGKDDIARSKHILPILFDPLNTNGDPLATKKRREYLQDKAIRVFVPFALRQAVSTVKVEDKKKLLLAADRCEKEGTIEAALNAKEIADAAAHAAAANIADVAYAAYAATNAAANAANAANYAANAYAAANAAAEAAHYAYGNKAREDFIVNICLPILKELIEMGPHAMKEELIPKCNVNKYLEIIGAK